MKNYSKRWLKWLGWIVFIVILIIASLLLWQQEEIQEILQRTLQNTLTSEEKSNLEGSTEKIVTIQPRQVNDWLKLSGAIQPIAWYEVNSTLSSHVSQIHFTYGDTVKKDQLLLSLDTSEQQNKLRQQTTALIQAQLASEKLKNWAHRPEVLGAKRQLDQIKAQVSDAKHQLKETQHLYDMGIISRLELKNLKTNLASQQQSQITADEFLAETIANGGQAQQRIAKLNLTNATQAVTVLKKKLDQAKITSPIDGIVFRAIEDLASGRKNKLHVGSTVALNTPILAIADLSGITIEFHVSEAQLLFLQRNQAAMIYVDALPNVTITGKINYIAGRASKNKAKDGGKETPQFRVEVSAAAISAQLRDQLRIGMSASVRIKTYDNLQAIVIPFEALIVEGDERFVDVINANEQREKRQVQVYNTLVDGIEIAQGLKAGERIVITTPREASQ